MADGSLGLLEVVVIHAYIITIIITIIIILYIVYSARENNSKCN